MRVILDHVLIALAPNSLVQTNKVYRLTPSESLQFCKWIRNMGLEDALFYKGVSHLGSRLDTEVYQTIYPQFDLETYIKNSENTINKFSLERVLKFFSKFTWKEIVFYRFGIKAFHSFKLNLVRFTDCAFMLI